MSELSIAGRFHGPPDSGNGGYTCGLTAASLPDADAVEVTLRQPPPLERLLQLDDGTLTDGDAVVASARPVEVDIELPPAVGFDEAERLAAEFDVEAYRKRHFYPTCFGCGPDRDPGDGLRIFPGEAGGDLVAWPWVPDASMLDVPYLWTALDCPSGHAWIRKSPDEPVVLGRLAARVRRLPQAGEPLVVAGWPIARDGRKLTSGTVIWSGDEVVAEAFSTWILLDERQRGTFRPVT